jgi:hypothetical protein
MRIYLHNPGMLRTRAGIFWLKFLHFEHFWLKKVLYNINSSTMVRNLVGIAMADNAVLSKFYGGTLPSYWAQSGPPLCTTLFLVTLIRPFGSFVFFCNILE